MDDRNRLLDHTRNIFTKLAHGYWSERDGLRNMNWLSMNWKGNFFQVQSMHDKDQCVVSVSGPAHNERVTTNHHDGLVVFGSMVQKLLAWERQSKQLEMF